MDNMKNVITRDFFSKDVPIMLSLDYRPPYEEKKYHMHDFFELAYIVEGEGMHIINESYTPIKTGDFFIININTYHRYTGPLKIINCLFYPEFIDKTLLGCKNFFEVMNNYLIKFNLTELSDSPTEKIYHDKNDVIRSKIFEMYNEFQASKPGYQEIIRSILIEIIIYSLRTLHKNRIQNQSDIISECIVELEKNYLDGFSLSDFCENKHYDISYISRKFTKETGMSFSKYIQKLRIEESCRLLVNTDKSIAEISEIIGYSDKKYFFSLFKRLINTTPGKYRLIHKYH